MLYNNDVFGGNISNLSLGILNDDIVDACLRDIAEILSPDDR